MKASKGRDGCIWKDHARNYAPCQLPNINGTKDLNLSSILASLKCMLYGRAQ